MRCVHSSIEVHQIEVGQPIYLCKLYHSQCATTSFFGISVSTRICDRCRSYENGAEEPQRPDLKSCSVAPPGAQLHAILISIGLIESTGCHCDERAAEMNAWGPDGCREHREEIIGWLKESAGKLSIAQQAKAFVMLAAETRWNPLDPFGSIVDEAIRRAEARHGADRMRRPTHSEKSRLRWLISGN